MTAALAHRRREVEHLLEDLRRWAQRHDAVDAVVLVGSVARGEDRVGSDVDVVVLTGDPILCPVDGGWFVGLRPGSRLVRTATWGPVREQRYRLPSGVVVEVGLAPPSWAGVPLDAGTRRVLGDGHRVLHDPHRTLARAVAALPAAQPGR